MKQLSIKDIKRRNPILDQESAKQFPLKEMDKQWLLLTENIRRKILVDPKIREIVIDYVSSPVNESLPNKFLDSLSVSKEILEIREKFKNKIIKYLNLAPVPEEQINPDIKNAKQLPNLEYTIEILQKRYGINTPEYYEELKEYIDSDTFLYGITRQEKLMIAQRYRFARDIKLLTLQAEFLKENEILDLNNQNEIKLPSGIIININTKDNIKIQELLNPQNWKKRKQLKDRVYKIEVGQSKYILKEKKTARHIDTKKNGHKSGNTSLEELEIAKFFQENCVIEKDNIKVSWENPIASVVFPDGFQFTIFKYKEGLLEDENVTQTLTQEILRHKKDFKDEFAIIKVIANKFKDNPKVLAFEQRNTKRSFKTFFQGTGLIKKQIPELTFEEFAAIKALRLEEQARILIRETLIKNGYTNDDTSDYAYKINSNNKTLQIEIFGFDFEYFSKISNNEIKERLKRHEEVEQESAKHGIDFLFWSGMKPVTKMQKAGYFAMLETEGLLQAEKLG